MSGAGITHPEADKNAVLKRLSRQLDHLAAEVYRVEHAIGDRLAVSDLRDHDTVQRLQSLDYLRQSLEDLALLTLYLSDANGNLRENDLAARLRLEATRQLLDPCDPHKGTSAPQMVGEVDFF